MGFESQSELVEFKVESAQFIDIQPRPRADARPDLERVLLDELKKQVEVSVHGCGEYTAWYRGLVQPRRGDLSYQIMRCGHRGSQSFSERQVI